MVSFWVKYEVLNAILDVIHFARNILLENSGLSSFSVADHLGHYYHIGVRFLTYKNETGEDLDSECFKYHCESLFYIESMTDKEKLERNPSCGYFTHRSYDIRQKTVPDPTLGTPRVAVTNHRAFLRFYGEYVIPKVITASHYGYNAQEPTLADRFFKNELGVERLQKFNLFFLQLTDFLFELEDREETFTKDKLREWFHSTDVYVEYESSRLRLFGKEAAALALEEAARAKAATQLEVASKRVRFA